VMPISALSRRAGRRTGLTVALGAAAVGAAGVVLAGVVESFVLLCAASAVFGSGNTGAMLARYAAADLSTPQERGRAIGRVVFATTFGAVAGPNLLAPAGDAARALGLPELTGLYLFAVAAFVLVALVLQLFLRPDPLQLALRTADEHRIEAPRVPLRVLLAPTEAVTGLATVVTANFVMVAVMAMAPVHLESHGYDLEVIGLVVSLHVAGMFAPAPLTGWLTDRFGPVPMAFTGAGLLALAGAVAAAAGHGAGLLAIGLGLLGVGWNVGLIAGSTLLASAVPIAQRPRVEGVGELSMGVAAATATAISGPVVGLAGYAVLAVAGATAAAALAPFLLAVARRGVPAVPAPANRVPG
jgi:MFS family permease